MTINALISYLIGKCRAAGIACPMQVEWMPTSESADRACTMGADAVLMPHFQAGGGHVLLVDCEGSDLGNTDLHDKLFTASLLVASELTMMAEGALDNRVLTALGRLATTGALFRDGEWPGLAILLNKMTSVLVNGTTDDTFKNIMMPIGDVYDRTREVIHRRFSESSRWAATVQADITANPNGTPVTRQEREELVRDSLTASPVIVSCDRMRSDCSMNE